MLVFFILDAIFEIRSAVKLGEETLISKVTQMLEKTSSEFKEVSLFSKLNTIPNLTKY